jgi:hypothetical protein
MKKNSKKQTAKRKEIEIEHNAPSAAKYPDFAARCKRIFGSRVLTVADDLIKDRGRY